MTNNLIYTGFVLMSVLCNGASATPGDAIPTMDRFVSAEMSRQKIPGMAVAVVKNGEVVLAKGYGFANLEHQVPVTTHSIFQSGSIGKQFTAAAIMLLGEQGKLRLDDRIASYLPRTKARWGSITLRHLLTHTAGFSYEVWDANTQRYVKTTGMPSTPSGKIAALRTPLAFDPGDRWLYGTNIDWVGRTVEATSGQPLDVYFQENIFGPLGMKDSGFVTTPEQRARQASVHVRKPDGSLEPQPLETPFKPEFYAGGGGLYSTAPDYLTFLQMLLADGSVNGVRILRPETVALMGQNQIGDIEAGVLKTSVPARSNDVDFFPGMPLRWGLGYMINVQPGPDGRSAGSLTWAGIFNTYYWIDPAKHVAGLIMVQFLPFADQTSVKVYGQFERSVYNALKSA